MKNLEDLMQENKTKYKKDHILGTLKSTLKRKTYSMGQNQIKIYIETALNL
jgi:hypothetical protein